MARPAWLLLDLVLVGLFAVLGRLSHYDSLSLGGWWQTAWPFLLGTLLGWVTLLVARRPVDTPRAGALVWLVTLVGGMLLRLASDQGTAAPFVVVATLVLGALLVLPRLFVRRARRHA
ncbi:DUF3054 domain-containing protein [Nocardioides seonyuensis]|uniref:DUF3054 domain-containing protein n=1 Tax=Nocardioides seonyuensis TaxID=2518371 RepID=A0A4P7IBR4_9ACTN|nr:DUF3054 domain-containing protein [Nocardioides seonyuensis]QBX54486.1 DUF3054 domain-containing protein [Nocardioides seonyuensis]